MLQELTRPCAFWMKVQISTSAHNMPCCTCTFHRAWSFVPLKNDSIGHSIQWLSTICTSSLEPRIPGLDKLVYEYCECPQGVDLSYFALRAERHEIWRRPYCDCIQKGSRSLYKAAIFFKGEENSVRVCTKSENQYPQKMTLLVFVTQ